MSGLVEIPVGAVAPNRFQPRSAFDDAALVSLAASIAEVGVLQPILVRPGDVGSDGQPTYELIAGERRWRAAKRAGLATIPALVKTVDDLGSIEQAVVENLHRQDLNPLEEAAAYQQLLDDFGYTHEQLAKRVGKSRATITNLLRLFQLPPGLQKLVRDGVLGGAHARALLAIPDRAFQEHLARRAVEEGLSVRAVEEAVRVRLGRPARTDGGATATDAPPATPGAAASPTDPTLPAPHTNGPVPEAAPTRHAGVIELEELLSAHLDTRVRVDLGAGKGKVVVEFADLADLERLYRIIASA